jgi:hypothetical protein
MNPEQAARLQARYARRAGPIGLLKNTPTPLLRALESMSQR